MKVLLLDTAFGAAPIYDYLIGAGHDVWVTGNRSMDLLARRAGERWIEQDYSRVDEVQGHVDALGIERVVPGCTDVSIETCLKLAVSVGRTDSPATHRKLGNKRQFREISERLDLPAPRVFDRADFPRAGRYICKPVDGFSGRGIAVIDGDDVTALDQAYQAAMAASPTSSALIETFVEGQLYSCTAFIEERRIIRSFYVIEGSSVNPFAVDTSYVVDDMPRAASQALEAGLDRLCNELCLVDGLLHTQFILSDGAPFIVEVSRRCPGDLYGLLIEYSTGYPYAPRAASYYIGEQRPVENRDRRHILRHTVTSDKAAIYGGLRFRFPVPVKAFYPMVPMGTDLLPRQGNRAGLLFAEFESAEDLQEAYQRFLVRDAYDAG